MLVQYFLSLRLQVLFIKCTEIVFLQKNADLSIAIFVTNFVSSIPSSLKLTSSLFLI